MMRRAPRLDTSFRRFARGLAGNSYSEVALGNPSPELFIAGRAPLEISGETGDHLQTVMALPLDESMNSGMSMLEEPPAELGHHISEENWPLLPGPDDELAPS